MNYVLLLFVALAVGALLPIQAASNAGASRYLGDITYAALLSFLIGGFLLSFYILLKRPVLNDGIRLFAFPAYIVFGGVISVVYTLSITYLAPRLGVGNTLFLIITGQLFTALIVDHFGLFGSLKTEFTITKVFGVMLIILGVYLAKKPT